MAGLFSRLHNWIKNETVKSADLNAELNNIINNIDPSLMSGDSANVAQMQNQVNPGSQGSESLATTTVGELERLRYVISRAVGGTYWYDTPALSLSQINILLSQGNASPPPNRVSSGLTRVSSNQPAFLVANGSNATLKLKGSVTPFVYYVAGVQYTISTDVTYTFSSLAPSSNNTATVNDSSLIGQASSATQGEGSTILTVSSAGSNITALQGKLGAFKIVDGANTEYFVGFVNSSTQITKCFRGYFFDSSSAPIVRTVVNNADTITLMKLFWMFATTAGSLDSTSNPPSVSIATPTSPASGDYWYDLAAKIWKKYNGSAFVAANATFIGYAICNTTNCIATRSADFYGPYDYKNTINLEIQDNNTVRSTQFGQIANVYGNFINFDKALAYWIKPGNLDTGETDGNNKTFYVYLKDTGDVSLSTVIPYNRISDLQGSYHPYNPWRSLGAVTNDGSSHFSVILNDSSYSDLVVAACGSAGANNVLTNITSPVTAYNVAPTWTGGTQSSIVNTSYYYVIGKCVILAGVIHWTQATASATLLRIPLPIASAIECGGCVTLSDSSANNQVLAYLIQGTSEADVTATMHAGSCVVDYTVVYFKG